MTAYFLEIVNGRLSPLTPIFKDRDVTVHKASPAPCSYTHSGMRFPQMICPRLETGAHTFKKYIVKIHKHTGYVARVAKQRRLLMS